jgi:hypothetical protein
VLAGDDWDVLVDPAPDCAVPTAVVAAAGVVLVARTCVGVKEGLAPVPP